MAAGIDVNNYGGRRSQVRPEPGAFSFLAFNPLRARSTFWAAAVIEFRGPVALCGRRSGGPLAASRDFSN